MSKNFFVKILMALSWVTAAVLWLLSVVLPDRFGFFNFNWAVVVIAGINALAVILNGILVRKIGILKKTNIFLGAVLLVVTAVSVIFALALPESYIWPIIAVILTAAGLLSVLAAGAKKWDEGDNHKIGYKDYRARKAEEENKREEEDDDNTPF